MTVMFTAPSTRPLRRRTDRPFPGDDAELRPVRRMRRAPLGREPNASLRSNPEVACDQSDQLPRKFSHSALVRQRALEETAEVAETDCLAVSLQPQDRHPELNPAGLALNRTCVGRDRMKP